MVEPSLEDVFPGRRGQLYEIQSPRDGYYNCIAWAARDDRNWMAYWAELARQETAHVPNPALLRIRQRLETELHAPPQTRPG